MKKNIKQLACVMALLSAFSPNALAENNDETAKLAPIVQHNQQQKSVVEVVFVLDTTGSMASLIDGAKKKIWSIANTIVDINPSAEIRMALIAYRDRGDDYTVKTVHHLNTDVQALYSALTALTADGGGDTPESVNEALDKAINRLQWSDDPAAKRVLFLVGDAPPHMDYIDEKQYPAIVKEAVDKTILVNAVQAGQMQSTKKVWKAIAELGKGRYLPIPQSGGQIVQIETPYDDDILQKQAALDDTILVYGNREVQAEVSSKMSIRKAAPKATQVDNASYYAKKSGRKAVISGAGDLVADMDNSAVTLEKLTNSELPAELQNKTTAEKAAVIAEKRKARKALESEIASLVKQRDAYILEEKKAQKVPTDSFDDAVKTTLKKQLSK